ncbi:hypothetical protein [Iningainema tapete]|uniref:Uncharacterized protein n=1 Tax=Iningainema tapete BLCC-T55 TaxID=2748662 RepID=A0A8J6Y093_9CYAN|nr:hypothetical protein [Iningainema tapete]MBD2776668.1 hypothetical protein [Iningainema tapete BLCC-T55]
MTNTKITPAFAVVFSTVLGLTLVSGATSLWLSCQDGLSIEQKRLFESSSTTWQMGTGAIFGLLGAKAADILHEEESDDEEYGKDKNKS